MHGASSAIQLAHKSLFNEVLMARLLFMAQMVVAANGLNTVVCDFLHGDLFILTINKLVRGELDVVSVLLEREIGRDNLVTLMLRRGLRRVWSKSWIANRLRLCRASIRCCRGGRRS